MATTSTYRAAVIGTGQGGKPLARALADAGWKTAIIDHGPVGGTCVNTGCTPTKTMVASARVAWLARHAADWGVQAGPVDVLLDEVVRRKREIVERFRAGSAGSLERRKGLDLVRGRAVFEAPRRLRVELNDGGTTTIEADDVIIDTGARAAVPPIDGLEDVPFVDNASLMELERVPDHLVVLGGGYVGVEFAQMFRRFGSRVTIVQRGPQLLGREDADVAEALAGILREDGVDVRLRATATRVEGGEGEVVVRVMGDGGGEHRIAGSHLLVATGRRPNSDRMGLDVAGVEVDERGAIRVDERLRTTAERVYALGDVTGGPAFTHVSYDDFRILRRNLLEGGSETTADRLVPWTVYTDPQLGRVGMSEREAREAGRSIRVARLSMDSVARAIETGETRGLMKAVVDADTGRILGCAILGLEGGEVMSALQIAMMGELPYTAIRDGVFAHPTLVESLNNLFSSLDD